jgi:hypothetical protein
MNMIVTKLPPSTNSIVPSNSRPLGKNIKTITGPSFKARPIKHWRKQLNPIDDAGRGRAGLGMPMDTPGGSVYLGNQSNPSCITCVGTDSFSAGIKEDIRTTRIVKPVPSDSFYDPVNQRQVCVACNPENNIIKSAVTLLNKNYYTDSRAYLKSRCLLYDQKLSTNLKPGVEYINSVTHQPIPPSNSPNGSQVRLTQNCPKNCPTGSTVTTIYKPNNSQFAVQGAVSSSTRLDRLKYNTITNNGSSFYTAWGSAGANAGRYQGTSEAPYFLKTKNQPCVNFHINGNKTTTCIFPQP